MMMDMRERRDEPLADYLDRQIYSLYGQSQRGVGYVERHPTHTEVIEYIEDEGTGRPHPIDDAADHYLLRSFDLARRDLASCPVPRRGSHCGEVWSNGYRTECTETHGEIPWR